MVQRFTLFLLLVLSLFCLPAHAQKPELVKDINHTGDYSNMVHTNLFVWRGYVYYTLLYNHPTLPELFLMRTDGSAADAEVIYKESLTGADYGNLQNYFGNLNYNAKPTNYADTLNGKLIFTFFDSRHGYQLWKTDGTTAGTSMIKQTLMGATGSFYNFTPFHQALYYAAVDSASGYGLWQTDGTETGTYEIKKMRYMPSDVSFIVFHDSIYFSAADTLLGTELWVSDGTEAGTHLVKDINHGFENSSPADFALLNDTLFFVADDSIHGRELWKSDGTASGTTLGVNIDVGTSTRNPKWLISFKDALYFRTVDSVNNIIIWKSEGTPATTQVLKQVETYIKADPAEEFFPLQDHLYFTVKIGGGAQLWKTDGTAEGTVLVKSFNQRGILSFSGVNTTLYFVLKHSSWAQQHELWKSDGSDAGTTQVDSMWASAITFLTPFKDQLFFSMNRSFERNLLLKTRGTDSSTTAVTEYTDYTHDAFYLQTADHYGSYFFQENLHARIGNTLYFNAHDSIDGQELWRTNGTPEGTYMVKNINSVSDARISTMVAYNNLVIFNADDHVHGNELWKSDGTSTGTQLLKDIFPGNNSSNISDLTVLNNRVYFIATLPDSSLSLWQTDGTADGTVFIKEIGNSLTDYVAQVRTTHSLLFFFVNSPGNSTRMLWRSDGTISGTTTIKSFYEDFNGYSFEFSAATEDYYFFTTYSGNGPNGIWMSDGTLEGTRLASTAYASNSKIAAYKGSVYFFSDYVNLYKTDGTTTHVFKLPDLENGFFLSENSTANDKLFFFTGFGNYPYGCRVWATDGTESGTIPLLPSAIATVGNALATEDAMYFESSGGNVDGNHVCIFRSDGTPCATDSIKGIGYNADHLEEVPFDIYNDTLYFLSNLSLYGNELWKIKDEAATPPLITFYADKDSDGYGTPGNTVIGCAPPVGYVSDSTDCNDLDPAIHPGAYEIPDNNIDDNCNGVVDEVTGIDEASASSFTFSIYPNPASGDVVVSGTLDQAVPLTINVFDVVGKLIYNAQKKSNSGTFTMLLDVSKFSSGIYFIQLSANGESSVKKLIIER